MGSTFLPKAVLLLAQSAKLPECLQLILVGWFVFLLEGGDGGTERPRDFPTNVSVGSRTQAIFTMCPTQKSLFGLFLDRNAAAPWSRPAGSLSGREFLIHQEGLGSKQGRVGVQGVHTTKRYNLIHTVCPRRPHSGLQQDPNSWPQRHTTRTLAPRGRLACSCWTGSIKTLHSVCSGLTPDHLLFRSQRHL